MSTPSRPGPRNRIASTVKRLLVLVVGVTMCGAGVAMLVLPGPGFLVVFLGLLVLATEFSWAERALNRTRRRAADATATLQATRAARVTTALTGIALVIGGAIASLTIEKYRYAGISVVVGGFGTLAILLPATQRLLNRQTSMTSDADA